MQQGVCPSRLVVVRFDWKKKSVLWLKHLFVRCELELWPRVHAPRSVEHLCASTAVQTGPPRPSGLYLSPATSSGADANARRTILAVVESDQVKAAGLANAQLEREHPANMTLQVVILRHVSQ